MTITHYDVALICTPQRQLLAQWLEVYGRTMGLPKSTQNEAYFGCWLNETLALCSFCFTILQQVRWPVNSITYPLCPGTLLSCLIMHHSSLALSFGMQDHAILKGVLCLYATILQDARRQLENLLGKVRKVSGIHLEILCSV
jgi:hypothetical protein